MPPNNIIMNPGPNDILCGRGGGTNAHAGNIKFRKLVAAHKLRYLAASKSDKPGVARDVVREWRAMDPPGRFLAKVDNGKKREGNNSNSNSDNNSGGGSRDDDTTAWQDVGDKKAREKASQCLRERNGAANEAVAALVKTVTASGEACPEDYATLMNKAAYVKAQNDLTIQQQSELIKLNNMRENNASGGGGMNHSRMAGSGGGGSSQFCQEAFEPISIQRQRYSPGAGNFDGNNNRSLNDAEDDMIEAEIQRLLQQRQQRLMFNNQGNVVNNRGDVGRNAGHGGNIRGDAPQSGAPQPYMGEESVMREYEQLMLKQRELNMMAEKLNGMGGGGGGMNGGMGGLMNTFNTNGMSSHMMSQASSNMLNPGMNNMMNMNGNGMGGNNSNYGGQAISNSMQSNHNPDAAKDYMNRLRSLRQGGGGMIGGGGGGMIERTSSSSPSGYNKNPYTVKSSSPLGYSNNAYPGKSSSPSGYNNNAYSGNAGSNHMGNNSGGGSANGNNMMMDNMVSNMRQQMQGKKAPARRAVPEDFTIEEYQASLQQFLSHNDDFGSGAATSARDAERLALARGMAQQQTQHANGMTSDSMQQYENDAKAEGAGKLAPTNAEDGDAKQEQSSAVDDTDIPLTRNTFQSVDSANRPSFQSMDASDIRGTFKSVDTMDLMSIGNSINQIMDDDPKMHPEIRKKYGRRLSNAAGGSGRHKFAAVSNDGANDKNPAAVPASLNNFARLPGQTLEIKTLEHGNARASGGPRKIKKGIDPRLVAQAKMARHSVQTRESAGGRGSMLSIKDLNLDGVDDASRMSFGNMSVMSELTDFQDILSKGQGDSFSQL